jgi:hypothetical protein
MGFLQGIVNGSKCCVAQNAAHFELGVLRRGRVLVMMREI